MLLEAVKRNWGLSNTGSRQGCLPWLIIVIGAPRDIAFPLSRYPDSGTRQSIHRPRNYRQQLPSNNGRHHTTKMAPAQPELKKVRYLPFISWARLHNFCSYKFIPQYLLPITLLIDHC
jgi:hypothetical protein